MEYHLILCANRFTPNLLTWATPFPPVRVASCSCFPAFLIETKGFQIFSLTPPVGMIFEIVYDERKTEDEFAFLHRSISRRRS
jgi:hypothetical protein